MASHGFLPKQPPHSIGSVVYVVVRRCNPLRTNARRLLARLCLPGPSTGAAERRAKNNAPSRICEAVPGLSPVCAALALVLRSFARPRRIRDISVLFCWDLRVVLDRRLRWRWA